MDLVSIVVVIAAVGVLSLEAFADEVYEPIGRAVLSALSLGRFPGEGGGWLARVGVAATGLAVLLLGAVLLLWLVTILTG